MSKTGVEMNCPHCGVSVEEHEASRCLDAWVGRDVMGWKWTSAFDGWNVDSPSGETLAWVEDFGGVGPYYSTDIAAAWEVVGQFQILEVGKDDKGYFCAITKGDGVRMASAPSASLAICRAALKAVSVSQNERFRSVD